MASSPCGLAPAPASSETSPPAVQIIEPISISEAQQEEVPLKKVIIKSHRKPKPGDAARKVKVQIVHAKEAPAPPAPPPDQEAPPSPKPPDPPGTIPPIKVPQKPVDPREKMWAALIKRVNGYKYYINKTQTEEQKLLLKTHHISTLLSEEKKPNPHAVAAILREYATVSAANYLFQMRCSQTCALHGSTREQHIWKVLSNDQIALNTYRPKIVARDTAYQGESVGAIVDGVFHTDRPTDSYLMVDVYATIPELGLPEGAPLTPSSLAKLIGGKPLVMVLQRFQGMLADTDAGCWFRDGSTIRAYSDPLTSNWTPHNPLDWLHRPGSQLTPYGPITWTVQQSIGDIDIILVTNAAVQIQSFDDSPLQCISVAIPSVGTALAMAMLPSSLSFVRGWVYNHTTRKDTWVDNRLYGAGLAKFNSKTRSSWTYKTLVSNLEDTLIDKYPNCRLRDPEFVQRTLEITAQAIWTRSLGNISTSSIIERVSTGDLVVEANSRYLHCADNQPSYFTTAVKTLGVAVAAVAALKTIIGFVKVYKTIKTWVLQYFQPASIFDSDASWIQDVILGLSIIVLGAIRGFKTLKTCLLSYLPQACSLLGITDVTLFRDIIMAPLWEELAKTSWTFTVALALTEGCLRKNLGIFLFHILTRYYIPSYTHRVICHGAYNLTSFLINYYYSKPLPPTRFELFKRQAHDALWSEKPIDTSTVCVSSFPSQASIMPRQPHMSYVEPILDPSIVVTGDFNSDEEHHLGPPWYQYLPTSVPLFVPATSSSCVTAAIKTRILALPPPSTFLTDPTTYPVWRTSFLSLQKLCKTRVNIAAPVWTEVFDEWLENYPSNKRHMQLNAKKQIEEGRKYSSFTKIKAKCDEAIVKWELIASGKELETFMELKPRAVCNVEPRYQARLGPLIFWLTTLLKKQVFNIEGDAEIEVSDVTLRITFAPGLTDRELAVWINQALTWVNYDAPKRWWLIIAGDDSLLVKSYEVCVETDASKFDMCQGMEIQNASISLLAAYLSEEDMTVYTQMIHTKGCAQYQRAVTSDYPVQIDFAKRIQRMTGAPDTTLSNTYVNAASWVYTILRTDGAQLDVAGYQTIFGQLGLKMKTKIHPLSMSSFLKGSFPLVDSPEGEVFAWVPNPSRFLKMGKTLTDPRTIFKDPDLERATRQFVEALAWSFKSYKNVPLVGAFVQKYIPDRPPPLLPSFLDTAIYLVQFDSIPEIVPSPNNDLFEFYARYYHMQDSTELLTMHQQILDAPLFSFLEHPGYRVLAQRDY